VREAAAARAVAATSADLRRNVALAAVSRVLRRRRRVSELAAESVDKPAPNGTPREIAGAPVRNPKDVESGGSPGTSNEATKRLPP
jgi:hypothetical protein